MAAGAVKGFLRLVSFDTGPPPAEPAPVPPKPRVLHAAVPGRVRLSVPSLKGSPRSARALEAAASRWEGVRSVTASPVTGSVLCLFDPARLNAEQLVERVAAGVHSAGDTEEESLPPATTPNPALETLAAAPGTPEVPPPTRQERQAELWLGAGALAAAAVLLGLTRAYGHHLPIDQVPLQLAQDLHSPTLTRLMRASSALVELPILVPLTLLATSLGVGRLTPGALPWVPVTAVAGGGVLIAALKAILRRPRPLAFEHMARTMGTSLPSGHAFTAMCLYGLLAHHGLRRLHARSPRGRRAAALLLGLTALAILAVGVSRVYLGVHYPTDVLAGYGIGLLWLWLLAALNERAAASQPPAST